MERTIVLKNEAALFVREFANYGFTSADELVEKALGMLRANITRQQALLSSADLYAEVYKEDEELQEWTTSASQNWE